MLNTLPIHTFHSALPAAQLFPFPVKKSDYQQVDIFASELDVSKTFELISIKFGWPVISLQ